MFSFYHYHVDTYCRWFDTALVAFPSALAQRFPNQICQLARDGAHSIRMQVRLLAQVVHLFPLVSANANRRIGSSKRLRHTRRILRGLSDDLAEVAQSRTDAGSVNPAFLSVQEGIHEPYRVLTEGGGGVGKELEISAA